MESAHKKKIIIASVALALVAGGGYGYYNYSNKAVVPAANEHAGHGAAGMTVSGDKVVLDAKARQLAGVQTARAEKRALVKEIRTTGKIAINETGRAYITSRVMGRIDELYVTAEGQYIESGQAIAAVYSPDYIAAQEEYILAMDTVAKLKNASRDLVQINNRLLDAARRKLELLGISSGDIEHLAHTRKANTHMIVRAQFGGTVLEKQVIPGAYLMAGDKLYTVSDLSTVWLNADIYEKDVAAIQVGQEVAVTTTAYPGQNFSGRVSFISPVLDDATRTVKVRVEMDNSSGKLKPNMFVNATVQLPLGDSLVVPESSLLDFGSRKIVFVAQSEDTFIKREVTVGQAANGYVQVQAGLQSGETVVTAATFLIDSQTKLGNFGSHAGHGGGNTAAPAPTNNAAPAKAPAIPGTPPAAVNEHSGHSGH